MHGSSAKNAPERRSDSCAALLAAAQTEFLDQGFQAARIEDIARRAGMGKGSVYLHFKTKEALLQAVIEEGVGQRIEQAESFATRFEGSASDLLERMLRTNLLEFWDSNASGIYKLVIAESKRFPEYAAIYYNSVTTRAIALVSSTLELGIRQGEYRDIDVAYTARIIIDALENELVQTHAFAEAHAEPLDALRYIDALLALITRGAGREATS